MEQLKRAIKCLEYLEETSKRTEKFELLTSAADNDILKDIFKRAYDWKTTYGVVMKMPDLPSMAPIFSKSYPIDEEWATFILLLDTLASRELTGLQAVETIERFLRAVDPGRAKWYCRVINKDLKIGVNVATYGLIWPELKSKFGVSLAEKFDSSSTFAYPVAVEPKLDGLRITMIFENGKGMAKTRGDLEYNEILIGLLEELGPIVVNGAVDGEIMADWASTGPLSSYGGKRYKSPWGKTSAMLKTGSYKGTFNQDRITPEMWGEIRRDLKFWVFDQVSLDVYNPAIAMDKLPFHDRRKRLENTVRECHNKFGKASGVVLMPQTLVYSEEDLEEKHVNFLAQQHEGTMIKVLNACYLPSRTTAMLKRKEEEFIDGVILEVLPGKVGGRNENRAGSYRVRLTSNNKITKCNVLGDANREAHWEQRFELPGTHIEMTRQLDAKAVTDKARFPTFIRLRDDLPKSTNLSFEANADED